MKTRIIISNWKPIGVFGKNSLGKPQVQITQCIHYMHILWGINIKWIINILEYTMLDYFCIKNGFYWYKNSLSIILNIFQNYLVESILDQGWEALIFFFFGGAKLDCWLFSMYSWSVLFFSSCFYPPENNAPFLSPDPPVSSCTYLYTLFIFPGPSYKPPIPLNFF